uniref:Methyltransferase FkbM domain-containing protein n=1 Tax=uncultured Thiotrichaceae bacterium TaxID=298394 RepID=A0A6S6ULC9_9GAMM|nr:MAG: Unknown protein [uncultured Thiotrichaceae bacterium]
MNEVIKKIEKAYYRVLGYYPANINGLKFRLDPYHTKFWKKVDKGEWEPDTYKIMSRFLNTESVYCDIGAWIGPTVVYASKICKKVICFEPDPFAYRYLHWNIELNDLQNITALNFALSNQVSMQRMSSFSGRLGDSMSSLLDDNHESPGVDVPALTWDAFIDLSETKKIDFIKIDIEGGEFELLPTLKNYLSEHKPIVYLSTHAPYLDAGLRKEKMQQVIDVMGMYDKCLDHNLEPIDIGELLGEEATTRFCSYVFMD